MLQNQKTNEEFSIHKKGRYAEIRRRMKMRKTWKWNCEISLNSWTLQFNFYSCSLVIFPQIKCSCLNRLLTTFYKCQFFIFMDFSTNFKWLIFLIGMKLGPLSVRILLPFETGASYTARNWAILIYYNDVPDLRNRLTWSVACDILKTINANAYWEIIFRLIKNIDFFLWEISTPVLIKSNMRKKYYAKFQNFWIIFHKVVAILKAFF